MAKKGLSQAELLAQEYSHAVAARKPPREDPAAVRARTDAAIARADAEERRAREQAQRKITSRRELEAAARKLRKQLRGDVE